MVTGGSSSIISKLTYSTVGGAVQWTQLWPMINTDTGLWSSMTALSGYSLAPHTLVPPNPVSNAQPWCNVLTKMIIMINCAVINIPRSGTNTPIGRQVYNFSMMTGLYNLYVAFDHKSFTGVHSTYLGQKCGDGLTKRWPTVTIFHYYNQIMWKLAKMKYINKKVLMAVIL